MLPIACPRLPSRLLVLAPAILATAPASLGRAAALVGAYKSTFEGPVVEFTRDGARKQIGTNRVTSWLQLNADGTLRTASTSTYTTDISCFEGVWQLKEGRLYFVLAAVPRPNLQADSRWLGAPRVAVTDRGLRFTDLAGAGLGSMQFARTDAEVPGSFPALAEMPELKVVLTRITRPAPRPRYAGVASERALKALVHHAVATRDIAALTGVTYPLLAGIEPDPEFSTYMQYMNWLAFGVPQVKDVSEAAAAKNLAQVQREGGGSFPASVSSRGMFLIGRTSGNGASTFSGIYYGVVAGRWAILGNPYRPPPAGKR